MPSLMLGNDPVSLRLSFNMGRTKSSLPCDISQVTNLLTRCDCLKQEETSTFRMEIVVRLPCRCIRGSIELPCAMFKMVQIHPVGLLLLLLFPHRNRPILLVPLARMRSLFTLRYHVAKSQTRAEFIFL